VDSLRPGDKMVVFKVAATAEVKQPETSEKSALRRAILSARQLDSPTRTGVGAENCGVVVRDPARRANPEIHLFQRRRGAGHGIANKALPWSSSRRPGRETTRHHRSGTCARILMTLATRIYVARQFFDQRHGERS